MIATMDAQGDSPLFLDFPKGSPEKAPGYATVPVPTAESSALSCQSPPFAAFRLGPFGLEKNVAVATSSAAVDPPSSEVCTEAYETLLDYILHRTNIVEDTDELLRCIAKIDVKTKATLIPLVEPYLDPNNGAIYASRGDAAETPPQAEMEANAEAMYGNHLTNFSLYVFQKPTFIGSVQDALRSFRLCPDTPPASRATERHSPSPTSEKCGGRPSAKGTRLREKKPCCAGATVTAPTSVLSPRVPRPSEPLFWRALAHLHLFSVVHGSNEVSSSLVVPRLVQLEDFLQEVEYLLRESRRFGFLAATMAMKAVTQWVPWLIWGSKEKKTTKPISETVSNNGAGLRSTPAKKPEGTEYVARWCQGVVLDLVDFSSSHFVARGEQSYHAFGELDVMLYVHLLTSMTEILYHPNIPAFIISHRPQTVERLLAASVRIFSSTVLQSLAGTPSLLKITHPLLYILIRLLTAQAPADEGREHNGAYCSEETNKERRGLIGMKLLGPAAGACSNCNELATAMCEGVYGLCAQPARGGRLGIKEGARGEESSEGNKEMLGCYWSPPEKLVWWLIMKRCLEQGQPLDGDKLLRLLNSAFETMCMKYLLGQGERPKEELKTITAPSPSAEGTYTTYPPGVVAGNASTSDDRKEGLSRPGTEDSSEDRLFSRRFCCNCWTPLAFSTASSESSSAPAVPVDAVSDVLPYELAALLQQLASLHYTMLTAAAAVDSTREAGQQTCKNEVEENRLEDVDLLVRDIMNTGQKGQTGVLGSPPPRKANVNKCGGKKGKHDGNRNHRTRETRQQDGGLEVKPDHEIGGGDPGAVTGGVCVGDGLFRSGGDRLRGICGAGLVYPWAVRAMRAVVAEKGVAMAAAGAERNVVVEGEATEENGEKVDDVVVMVQKREEMDEKLGDVLNGHNYSDGTDKEETSEPTTGQQADKHNTESKKEAHTTEVVVSGNGGVVSSAGVVKVEGPALIVRCSKCSTAMYCSRRCLEMHQPLHACVCVPHV
eukprot:GHVS01002308.1.p1 GENE.GHVS01002308.1~~GHVS01002308.1.p1  ORF type:complete len:1000 (-),score=156.11 GHVS01002308.1:1829-4828(-)